MNWSHLKTLLWVRWRLSINYLTRGSVWGAVLMLVLGGAACVVSLGAFIAALWIGLERLKDAPPEALTYLCDGWILAFLFFWMIGLLNELQRAEMLSVDKLLHLPTTLTEVFLFNFLSSLVTLTTITFVPPLVGLSIAAVIVKGPAVAVMFPLIGAFVLMMCALTYQFRGWLATLMQNKRRRQTVIVAITMTFIVIVQVPNFANMMFQQRMLKNLNQKPQGELQEKVELQKKLATRQITPQEFIKKSTEIDQRGIVRRHAEIQALQQQVNQALDIANICLPIGWMAYGAQSAARGNVWPGIAGTLGMLVIAGISLRRSYFTTLRYFTGEATGQMPGENSSSSPTAVASPSKGSRPIVNWIEKPLPLVSDPVAAIAWTTLRGMTRAPEVKMLLMGPLFVLFMYGAMMMGQRGGQGMPALMKSIIPLGILGLSVAGVSQLSHNSFGFDRAGFRSYVLSGVPRWEILFGKNLALVPLVFLLTVPVLSIVQILSPAPWTHLLATLLEIPSTILLLALVGNVCSIYSPIFQSAGSMKPNNVKLLAMFTQFVFGLITLFVLGIVTSLPLGLELLLQYGGIVSPFVPVAPLMALLEFGAAIGIYLVVVRWQGNLLQARECRILDVVTQRGE